MNEQKNEIMHDIADPTMFAFYFKRSKLKKKQYGDDCHVIEILEHSFPRVKMLLILFLNFFPND